MQGDQAAVHWTNQGMNRHKEPYQNEGVTILEIAGNMILIYWKIARIALI
jgi:hypothetical protein